MDFKYILTSFDGRIRRGQFWAGVGVLLAVGIVSAIVDGLLGTSIQLDSGGQLGIIGLIVSIASIYFALAIYAKRWHDRGKSGWWTLIIFVPFIGAIWLLVELGILEGARGPNQYGPDPLG